MTDAVFQSFPTLPPPGGGTTPSTGAYRDSPVGFGWTPTSQTQDPPAPRQRRRHRRDDNDTEQILREPITYLSAATPPVINHPGPPTVNVPAQDVEMVEQPRRKKKKKRSFTKKLRRALPWLFLTALLLFALSTFLFFMELSKNNGLRQNAQDNLNKINSMSIACDQVTVEWKQINKDWADIMQNMANASRATILNDPTTAASITQQVNDELQNIESAMKTAEAHSNICAHGAPSS